MKCEAAHRAILAARPTELRGEDTGALAVHLHGCADCRARAMFICTAMDSLRVALPPNAGTYSSRARAPVRRIAVGLSIAAGLVAAVSLGVLRSTPHAEHVTAIAPMHGNVVIENAQGRDVTVLEAPDTTVIVFWNRGAP